MQGRGYFRDIWLLEAVTNFFSMYLPLFDFRVKWTRSVSDSRQTVSLLLLITGAVAAERKLDDDFAELTDEDIAALRDSHGWQHGGRRDEAAREEYWHKLEKEWKEMATQQGRRKRRLFLTFARHFLS